MTCFFFFNDTATTEIYTLSLHDALPISFPGSAGSIGTPRRLSPNATLDTYCPGRPMRSFASLVSVITALSVMGSPASSRVASAVCASIGWAVVDGAAAVADWGAAALVPDSVAWAVASAESPPPQPAVSAAAAMVMMIVLRMRWVSAGWWQLRTRWMLRRTVRVPLSRSMSFDVQRQRLRLPEALGRGLAKPSGTRRCRSG